MSKIVALAAALSFNLAVGGYDSTAGLFIASDATGAWSIVTIALPSRGSPPALAPSGSDDTAAITAALAACTAGNSVNLSVGLFRVTKAIAIPSGCSLRGARPGVATYADDPTCPGGTVTTVQGNKFCAWPNATELIETNNSGNPVISVSNVSNVGVENLFVWGGFFGNSAADIIFNKCASCWMAGVKTIVTDYKF